MGGFKKTAKNRGAAGGTNWRGYKDIFEAYAISGDFVDLGGFEDFIAITTEVVKTLVVDEYEKDIRFFASMKSESTKEKEAA